MGDIFHTIQLIDTEAESRNGEFIPPISQPQTVHFFEWSFRPHLSRTLELIWQNNAVFNQSQAVTLVRDSLTGITPEFLVSIPVLIKELDFLKSQLCVAVGIVFLKVLKLVSLSRPKL